MSKPLRIATVLAPEPKEETVLSVRLSNARRDAGDMVTLLQRVLNEAEKQNKPQEAARVYELLQMQKQVQRGLEGLKGDV